MIGVLDLFNSSNSNKVGKYASGGILNEASKDIIKGGFTISQFNNILNEYFPYSFGFKVFKLKNTNRYHVLMADYDDAPSSIYGYNDSEIGGKLFFPQYKRDHEINFQIYQGGENTYFKFLINDENGNYWVGEFGFKDRGDVSSDYITGFIAFLMECYELPFSIKHTVYSSGGKIEFERILDKTTFSEGLKKSLIEDLKSSGFKDFSDLKGNTVQETQKNIEREVSGFDSGKNTYLQAQAIAQAIHGESVAETYPYTLTVNTSDKMIAELTIRGNNGIIMLQYPTASGYEFKIGSYDWEDLEEIKKDLESHGILNSEFDIRPENISLTNMLSPVVSIDNPAEIHTEKFQKALEYLILNKGYKTSDILLQTNFVTTDEVEKELKNDFRKYKNQIALKRDLED